MIHSLEVKNYTGDKLLIELGKPEKSGFRIISISGLGPCKSTINMTEVTTSDGALFNSARVGPRNIIIQIVFEGCGPDEIEALRQKTYKFFPIKQLVELSFVTDHRKAKAIGYVESNEPSIFSAMENTQISIICPDSYFYSLETATNITTFYGIEPVFEFPFSNESLSESLLEFGVIKRTSEANVIYEGDSEIGVTIIMHAEGSVSNIDIYNTGTKESMHIDTNKIQDITGSPIAAGDDIIICTVKGKKSIMLLRDGKYTNILNSLGRDSKWFQLAKGDNVFAFTAEQGITNLRISIENDVIYEGI